MLNQCFASTLTLVTRERFQASSIANVERSRAFLRHWRITTDAFLKDDTRRAHASGTFVRRSEHGGAQLVRRYGRSSDMTQRVAQQGFSRTDVGLKEIISGGPPFPLRVVGTDAWPLDLLRERRRNEWRDST